MPLTKTNNSPASTTNSIDTKVMVTVIAGTTAPP
jgi:hypothetical protein